MKMEIPGQENLKSKTENNELLYLKEAEQFMQQIDRPDLRGAVVLYFKELGSETVPLATKTKIYKALDRIKRQSEESLVANQEKAKAVLENLKKQNLDEVIKSTSFSNSKKNKYTEYRLGRKLLFSSEEIGDYKFQSRYSDVLGIADLPDERMRELVQVAKNKLEELLKADISKMKNSELLSLQNTVAEFYRF
jgi:hypothetical protein